MQAEAGWTEMAGIPRRDRETFLAHRAADTGVMRRVIELDGELAGEALSFMIGDGRRVVGYGVRRRFWGQGIASRALCLFLDEVAERPLYATVLPANARSRRVLEKNGFVLTGPGPEGDDLLYVLV